MTDRFKAGLVATIGMFDGVHAGHRHLLGQLTDEAHRRGLESGVITFRQHPTHLLTPDCPVQLITTPHERDCLLRGEGVDRVVMLDFTEELRALTSEEFMRMLRDRYAVRALLIGFNHRFGSDRAHGFTDYQNMGRKLGIDVVLATEVPDVKVSSSIIRRLISGGRIEKATGLLGRNFRFEGIIVAGRQLGRTIGFPTANIRPLHPELILPGAGVYAGKLSIEDGATRLDAMVNIGWRPTVNSDIHDVTIEAHLLDFEGVIYGREVTLEFCNRLRDERRFSSVEALRAQLIHDVASARKALASGHSTQL